jgi:hypothetical protein
MLRGFDPSRLPEADSALTASPGRDAIGARGFRELVSRRDGELWMPPLATEEVDRDAVTLLRRWVEQLPE